MVFDTVGMLEKRKSGESRKVTGRETEEVNGTGISKYEENLRDESNRESDASIYVKLFKCVVRIQNIRGKKVCLYLKEYEIERMYLSLSCI